MVAGMRHWQKTVCRVVPDSVAPRSYKSRKFHLSEIGQARILAFDLRE